MTLENHFKNIPNYYRSMYLDGYTPQEILYASRQAMYNTTTDNNFNFHITSEVKKK